MRKVLCSDRKRDAYRGDKFDSYTLHFDEKKGFYVIHEWEKDYASGGTFTTREGDNEMTIPDFLKNGPADGVKKLREMLSKMFP